MRILTLENSGQVYTSQVYLVLGDASRLADVNTLVDVGRDPAVLESLAKAPTGVGKHAVEQVVLTHGHYDHVELLGAIRGLYHPKVCAFQGSLEGVDQTLADGDEVKAGDRIFEVLHTPGHSSDSICLYCRQDGVLFAGDTPLLFHSADGSYEDGFVAALEKICAREVRAIYFGHGAPLLTDCNGHLRCSLALVQESMRRGCGCPVKSVSSKRSATHEVVFRFED